MADFGVARFQDQGGIMTAETGTYRWMAPEVQLYLVEQCGCILQLADLEIQNFLNLGVLKVSEASC